MVDQAGEYQLFIDFSVGNDDGSAPDLDRSSLGS